MNMQYVYKEEFSVIGKLGQGSGENPWEWINPIWENANSNFNEIEAFVKKEGDIIEGLWGIMSDFDETFARWDKNGGKYLACCEVESDAVAPFGWVKWTVPSQTYLVAKCKQEDYLSVFEGAIQDYIPNNHLQLVGAVHEHYPEPGNPTLVELYFPIAKGNYFCQSCGMPMNSDKERGTEKDQSKSEDYCHYCYMEGTFCSDDTMEEMIISCIPFVLEAGECSDAETARNDMLSYFPKMNRWKNSKMANTK